MATTTTVAKPDSAQLAIAPGETETLAQKIARYSSPEFKAALIRHFHAAKQRALQDSSRITRAAAVSPTKARR